MLDLCWIEGCKNVPTGLSTMCDKHIAVGREYLRGYLSSLKVEVFHGEKLTNLYAIKAGYSVKFGISETVKRRFVQLQVSNAERLTLYGVIAVPPRIERIVHARVSGDGMWGEWFRWTGDVIRIAKAIRAKDQRMLLAILSEETYSSLYIEEGTSRSQSFVQEVACDVSSSIQGAPSQ